MSRPSEGRGHSGIYQWKDNVQRNIVSMKKICKEMNKLWPILKFFVVRREQRRRRRRNQVTTITRLFFEQLMNTSVCVCVFCCFFVVFFFFFVFLFFFFFVCLFFFQTAVWQNHEWNMLGMCWFSLMS